jgi:hypothetical protein
MAPLEKCLHLHRLWSLAASFDLIEPNECPMFLLNDLIFTIRIGNIVDATSTGKRDRAKRMTGAVATRDFVDYVGWFQCRQTLLH